MQSRVITGLAIMGYEPLYHALQKMVSVRVMFWWVVIFIFVQFSIFLERL